MKRATFAFLLIPIVCAASCARASQDTRGVPRQRIVRIGDGISVLSGPVLTALPPDQRYRFVPPESIAMGVGGGWLASTEEPEVAELREVFSTVVGSGRWAESADSAQFDVTIFTRARMTLRREARPQLAANVSTCGQPSTQLQLCTDDPFSEAEVWNTEGYTFHIIRRRSDGAVRVWRHYGTAAGSVGSRMAADLREMLRAGDGR